MNEYLLPVKSIIIYKSDSETYAEIHNINSEGDFEAGRPFRSEEIKAFDIIVDGEKTLNEKKCFPYRNILGFESDVMNDKIAWIYPTCKIELHFSDSVNGVQTGHYYIPYLVFISDGKSVSIYAIKKKDILNLKENTPLYHAPFMNVYVKGNVCMGSAKIKKYKNVNEMIQSVENAFFQSTFTHTNHNEIVKGGLIDCYNNQKNKFDEKLLIESIKLNKIWK